jgi:hypothetical protein
MIRDIQNKIDNYLDWLRQGITVRQISEYWTEITTPFLDRHNDHLQIYAKKEGETYTITDDGYILDDLEHSGCSLETPKRQLLLQTTLNGFGLDNTHGRLSVNSSEKEFPRHIHNLLQGMLAINDLFATARSTVLSLFYEDVESWLEEKDIRYTPKARFMGRSRYEHTFDFVIPHSRKAPERFIQTLNRPSRDTTQRLAFAWMDVRDNRPKDAIAYAILNDADIKIGDETIEAMTAYNITPVRWTHREQYIKQLAA